MFLYKKEITKNCINDLYCVTINFRKIMDNNSNQNQTVPQNPQQIIINNQPPQKNGIGTAGFVLAILGLVFCWAPILCWILWALGAIFSFVGVFRKPKGLSIAGLIISVINLIILISMLGAIGAALASSSSELDSISSTLDSIDSLVNVL